MNLNINPQDLTARLYNLVRNQETAFKTEWHDNVAVHVIDRVPNDPNTFGWVADQTSVSVWIARGRLYFEA